MYGLKLATLAALVLAVALAVAPAAASRLPTTGTQITLRQCVAAPCASTYPANEPFFVRHGFITDGTEADLAILLDPETRFELTVDGQAVVSALELDLTSDPPSKRYVTNFRLGLAGVHTLVGCWYSEGVLMFCGTRTITFTD